MVDGWPRWRLRVPDGLPALAGRGRSLFLILWAAALGLVLVAGAAVLPTTWRNLTAPESSVNGAGLLLYREGAGRLLGPPIDRAAEQAGIRAGDLLLTVDGKPLPASPDAIDRVFAGPTGSTVTIVTRSPQGARRTTVLTRDAQRYRHAMAGAGLNAVVSNRIIRGLPVVGFLVVLGCAILLMARRARDRLSPWTSLMLLSIPLGSGQTAEWLAAHFSDPLLAYNLLNAVTYALLIGVLAAFPDGRFVPRWSFWVALVGAAATVITTPLPDAQSNIVLELAQLAAVGTIFWRYRRMPPGTGRQQIRWALFGFGASLAALIALVISASIRSATDSFTVYVWARLAGQVMAYAYTLVLMVALTVSLMRYKLYGADATISRSVAAGMLTLGLIALFAAAQKVIELIGEQYFGQQLGSLAGVLGAAIAATAIAPLHHRTSRWAERRFRSGLAALREGLPLLVGDLREVAGSRALADQVLGRVEGGVRASYGAIVLHDAVLACRNVDPAVARGWQARGVLPDDVSGDPVIERSDPLFPMRVPLRADGVGLIGWLLLGPRPDGSFYGREERAALHDIADPVARALAIAAARERRDAALAAREDRLTRSVDGLRRFIVDRYGVDPGWPSPA